MAYILCYIDDTYINIVTHTSSLTASLQMFLVVQQTVVYADLLIIIYFLLEMLLKVTQQCTENSSP